MKLRSEIKVLLIAAGVAAILLSIPGQTVTYTKPEVAHAAENTVMVTEPTPEYVAPPPEALATVSIRTEDPEPPQLSPEVIEKSVSAEPKLPHESMRAEVSAYTSSVDETDSTPNINAAGTKPGPGSIACPTRYEFGTLVFINGNEYRCDDRMNPRYADGNYFDIWIETKAEAFAWGRRIVTVRVVQ